MATGRTVAKWARVYVDGYDVSCSTRTIGPLEWSFDTFEEAALCDEVKNALPGHAQINVGALNGFLDNTAATGVHAIASGAGVQREVMVPIGIRAAPAIGDPVFMAQLLQTGYVEEGDGYIGVNIPFAGWDGAPTTRAYSKPWGVMLHAYGAETDANSATGDGVGGGVETTAGGWLMYQVFSGDGTATISIDDSADDSSFSALSGATSGVIDCSSVQSGIVALATNATVRGYLRWQLALGTATTVTFALAFVRG